MDTDDDSDHEEECYVLVSSGLGSRASSQRSNSNKSDIILVSTALALENMRGPDQVLKSDEWTAVEIEDLVQLRIPEFGSTFERLEPISVPSLLHHTAMIYPKTIALAQKVRGKWNKITYKQYERLVRTCAKAFLHFGLERYHSVCILGFNSPEWFISDLAAIYAGGLAVGIFTTSTKESCFYCAHTSQVNIVVLQDEEQLAKILSIRSKLKDLKTIIQYEGDVSQKYSAMGVITWKKAMEIGNRLPDDDLELTLRMIAINECCTLVYAFDAFENPKAVMLSHDNLVWEARSLAASLRIGENREILVSYLPLSHITAQIVDIYAAITKAASVYFAEHDALRGTLAKTLKEVRPTRFLAMPRVWERIQEKLTHATPQNNFFKNAITKWAQKHCLKHYTDKINNVRSNTICYNFAKLLVCNKIKRKMGLGRCVTFVSAAAPLSYQTKKYFLSIDVPIMDAFGTCESSGWHTVCNIKRFNARTVGITLLGAKTKIHDPDPKGVGEICMFGRHVFMGYLKNLKKTEETIDESGWMYSGDLGKTKDGLLYITGRLREVIVTTDGESISSIEIEQMVKQELPHISNAFLIGDGLSFLSILLTLRTYMDVYSGTYLDVLLPSVKYWLKSLGCAVSTVSELLASGPNQNVLDAIQEAIDRVNENAVSESRKIRKFAILPTDFSVATGELEPTMKIKRKVVLKKYEDVIKRLYS